MTILLAHTEIYQRHPCSRLRPGGEAALHLLEQPDPHVVPLLCRTRRFVRFEARRTFPIVPDPFHREFCWIVLEAFGHAVAQQVTILSASDTFLILGALTVFLMVVVMTLPIRTMPPRIHLANQ